MVAWCWALLSQMDDPGDKGVGLLELSNAGLQIPETVVLSEFVPADGDCAVRTLTDALDAIKVPSGGAAILRPSLRILRPAAASISGLYESYRTTHADIEVVLERIVREYRGSDRDIELTVLGPEKASKTMLVLLQPMLVADFSGVAHIEHSSRGPRIRLGIVAGHLSKLVSGEVAGWQCELTSADFGTGSEPVLIADEDDAKDLMSQSDVRALLAVLYGDLVTLWSALGQAREIEWAAAEGSIWYLQSQPLIGERP